MQLLFVLLVGGAQGFSPAVPPTATAAIRRRPSSPSVTKKFLSLDDFTEDELSGDDDPAVATAEGKNKWICHTKRVSEEATDYGANGAADCGAKQAAEVCIIDVV